MIKKITLSIILLMIVSILGSASWLYATQENHVFNFAPVADNHDYKFPEPFEEIWLESGGAKLHGIFYPTQV
jgi:hypothetical protein